MSQVYAFIHTDCIYESAAATMSLHATKAGAYRAMRQFTQAAWVKQRSRVDSGMHMGKGFWREHAASDPLRFTESSIEIIEGGGMSAQMEVAEWQGVVIDAVEEACREKIDGFSPGSRRYLLSTRDEQEQTCARNGANTLRIAEILGDPLELVRSRLRLLARNGLLIREHGDTEGRAAKWWVPGLLARLKREEG